MGGLRVWRWGAVATTRCKGMAGLLEEYRAFWREFRTRYRTTGAVLPSSRYLGRALARHVDPAAPWLRILEVGPGTGAVTREILKRLGPDHALDLVELNDRFVDLLRKKFDTHPAWRRLASQCRVIHSPVEELPSSQPYDVIVSGLPLNNFTAAEVEGLLRTLARRLKPAGILSFFEYIAIRTARSLVGGRADRQRLAAVGRVLDEVLRRCEVGREGVLRNVPPAWVHHVRFAGRWPDEPAAGNGR